MLKLITGPVLEPITVADVKAQCRIDSDAEDEKIEGLIVAFRSSVDGKDGTLCRACITQTWDLYLDRFPQSSKNPIQIPLPPLQSIASVQYYDTNGVLQTLPAENYFVHSIAEPAELYPAYNMSWPQAFDRAGSVIIRFVAGYGDNPADVPGAIRHAGLMTIAHWFANRESVNVGNIVTEMPQAVSSLLAPYKIRMRDDS